MCPQIVNETVEKYVIEFQVEEPFVKCVRNNFCRWYSENLIEVGPRKKALDTAGSHILMCHPIASV